MKLHEIASLDLDRLKNVEAMYKVIQAAKQDHAESRLTNKKFSLRDYERRLNTAYPNMDNKTCLQTAVRTTRIKDGLSRGNMTTISGNDLYRAVRFFLVNLSGYDWSHVIDVLSVMDGPYNNLIKLANEVPGQGIDLDMVISQRVGDFVKPGESPSAALRGLADTFDAMQKELRLTHTELDHHKRAKADLREKIAIAEAGLQAITDAYDSANPDKKGELQERMTTLRNLLKSLKILF